MGEVSKTVLVVSSTLLEFDWLRVKSGRLAEFPVKGAESVWDADDILKNNSIHAVLLDFDLEGTSAPAFCRILRKRGVSVPIIMVSESNAASDAVLSLDAGADDYVRKSVGFDELVARIRAWVVRSETCWSKYITIRQFVFDPYERLMYDDKKNIYVRLTDKESRCLRFLASRTNKFATKRELYLEIWGQKRPLNTHTLNTHIYRLRQKIERDPQYPRILVLEGSGYRLVV